MKMKEIKLQVSRMSDEYLMNQARAEYFLSHEERQGKVIAYGLILTGIVLCWMILPLILIPVGLLVTAIGKKHTKIKKIMFKELEHRGYKIVVKEGKNVMDGRVDVEFFKTRF